MRRRLRIGALAALLVFGTAVFAVPNVVEASMQTMDFDQCQGRELSVIEYARDPAEVNQSSDRTGTYENLTAAQQSLFDRGVETREQVSLDSSEFETADSLPGLLVRNESVYRVRVGITRCPLISGVPPAANPAIEFLLGVNRLVTGPLAPVLVVVLGVGLAFRLGRMLEY